MPRKVVFGLEIDGDVVREYTADLADGVTAAGIRAEVMRQAYAAAQDGRAVMVLQRPLDRWGETLPKVLYQAPATGR